MLWAEKTVVNSSYGRPLREHLKTTERVIASPLEACVLFLLEYGLKEEVSCLRNAIASCKLPSDLYRQLTVTQVLS